MKERVEEQINIMQGAIDVLVRLSYESDDMYNSHFGCIIETTMYHLRQNVLILKRNVEYLGGY